MPYKPTIGLEIHAEMKTRTKMFCDSLNDADEKHPNVNVCPVCMGHPGALPVINKSAVEFVIKVGLALGGKIADISKFDRKNYFYPDLPKAYQISQYDQPLVQGGELLGIKLTRIHLEEDTGTLIHSADENGKEMTLVDFNRASVPLMELVTDPDIKNAEQAVAFGKELRLILRYLGVSDADMEKGHMRLEANVSISKTNKLGTKVEVKNINSFRSLGSAIEYEIKRQEDVLEKGDKVAQETRGWDDVKQRTFSQRAKEEAHDYRYFPEPDLPPLEPTKIFDIEDMKRHLPELPSEKRERFQKEFKLSAQQASALVDDKNLADFFEASVSELARNENKSAAEKSAEELLFNYLTSDLSGLMNESGIGFFGLKFSPEDFSSLINLISSARIMSRQAKDILRKMFETGDSPEDILAEEGLEMVSDEGSIKTMVLEILGENQKAVDDFKKGKTASLQFLVGKTMAKLRGAGNPEVIRKIIEQELTK
ncbi:MAG TPA: Asp-tRNA(Asn)/Glu-tRNA(Gln) amidotransferase subunit GatB [Candidatus Paceibacterota bacterium]|nr:Asp-tRNA(Asn)/Glu-tRNA(Gln) amidotransferase subunit GatB [Candidatus Paceibacterota bacterium]